MKQIFESENISYMEVSEELIPDYLTMVNDIEHVDRFIGGPHEPYTEVQEAEWVLLPQAIYLNPMASMVMPYFFSPLTDIIQASQ